MLFGISLMIIPSCNKGIPEYEVYSIEYGWLPNIQLSTMLSGADTSLWVDMSAMVWLMKSSDGHNILVDAGYRPDYSNSTSQRIQDYQRPDLALSKLGISPEDISDIILTHIHFDHADGLPLFPNAHIWVQEAELEYYSDSTHWPNTNPPGTPPRFVAELNKLNKEGHVTLVDGDDQEIFEGIRVYTGPKHTYASQYVGVNTSGGTVILASDCILFYKNLELGLTNRITLDHAADMIAFDRMRSIASKTEWIIPGHDRAVFDKFPNPVKGVAQIQ
ncbi:N-acyl homoserine lactonase family protein [Bacteroidota bacterium]